MARRVGTAEVRSHPHTAARHQAGHSRHPVDRSQAVNREDRSLRVAERREGRSLRVVSQEDHRRQEAVRQEGPSRQEAVRQAGHSHHHPGARSLPEDSRHPAPESTRGYLCNSLL